MSFLCAKLLDIRPKEVKHQNKSFLITASIQKQKLYKLNLNLNHLHNYKNYCQIYNQVLIKAKQLYIKPLMWKCQMFFF